jgi:hypothetical protein
MSKIKTQNQNSNLKSNIISRYPFFRIKAVSNTFISFLDLRFRFDI